METKTGDTSAFSLHSYFWWTSSGTLWRGREIHCAEALNPQSIEFTGRLISPYWRTRHKRQLVKVSVVVILGIIPLQRLHVRSEDFLKKKRKTFRLIRPDADHRWNKDNVPPFSRGRRGPLTFVRLSRTPFDSQSSFKSLRMADMTADRLVPNSWISLRKLARLSTIYYQRTLKLTSRRRAARSPGAWGHAGRSVSLCLASHFLFLRKSPRLDWMWGTLSSCYEEFPADGPSVGAWNVQ